MSETILYLALISGAIGPLVTADASDLIAFEFTLVLGSIGPIKTALAMQETVLELTFVLVAISELASALTVIDFADLFLKMKITINGLMNLCKNGNLDDVSDK